MPAVYRELSGKSRLDAEARARAHRLRPIRWLVLAIFAFVLVAPAGALAVASGSQRVTVATTTPRDRAATHMLLKAEYELAKATLARVQATEDAVAGAAEALGDECKGVLRGAPNHSVIEEEVPPRSTSKLSGHAQGERARSELEERTIYLPRK